MRQLIYISRATRTLEFHEEAAILATARTCNQETGVTGVLLAKDRQFFQLLEGEHDTLEGTYRRIARDPRHIDLTILYDGETDEQRLFGSWRMGFVHLTSAEYAAGEGLLPNDDRSFAKVVAAAAPCSKPALILHEFWKANHALIMPQQGTKAS